MKNSISEYACFLRGINVGGHKKVPMAELRASFESLGFREVRTLLNSGNVVFHTATEPEAALDRRIAAKLKATFGFDIGVITRTMKSLRQMVRADPFKGIPVTPDTRLYVTFFSAPPVNKLELPYESKDKDLRILGFTDAALFTVLTLSGKRGSVDAMAFIEKTFGQGVTTRNWNTILRMVEKGS